MKSNAKAFLVTAILAITGVTADAAVRQYSKTIVVESPENLPVLSQNDAEAMYLHDTNDGRTFLYIEAQSGRELTALDVTDPAKIQRVAQTPIPATSAFDFVQTVGDEIALIRYRNGSGFALLSFKHYKHPTLAAVPSIGNTDTSEALGQTGLLLTSNDALINPMRNPRNYKVVDTSNPSQPRLLATSPSVKQRLAKADTGTLFLLNKDGVTVVRRLRVEEEHQIQLDEQRGN
jgi:hypothetical protein